MTNLVRLSKIPFLYNSQHSKQTLDLMKSKMIKNNVNIKPKSLLLIIVSMLLVSSAASVAKYESQKTHITSDSDHITTSNALNTCKAYSKAEDFFSCDDFGLNYVISGLNTPLATSNVIGMHYSFAMLRESFANNDLARYVTHMQDLVTNQATQPLREGVQYLTVNSSKKFHVLWITKPSDPRAIRNGHLENFLEQTKKFNDYDVILWTNLNKNELLELNPDLKSVNVTIKNIATLKTQYTKLLNVVVSPEDFIQDKTIRFFKGTIIDLAKYLIMESEGGILADLNFEFIDNFSLESLMPYDFVAIKTGFARLENYFFSAKPHHLIFKEVLNIMEEMLLNPSCGNLMLKSKLYDSSIVTEHFSMLPLAMSYLKCNNKNGNHDVLYDCIDKSGKDLSYPPELIEQFLAHEAIADKLYSDNFDDITEFTKSYISLFKHLSAYENPYCISSNLIGEDGLSSTWW